MRISAVVKRIINQFIRDKRTLALLIFAPMLILTLVNYVFTEKDVKLEIGVANEKLKTMLSSIEDENNIVVISDKEAEKKFKDKSLDMYIENNNQEIKLILEGSDSSINGKAVKAIQEAMKNNAPSSSSIVVDSYYGNDNMDTIDFIGPLLIGFFIFFFVFLISGVSFLRERTSGTLERLLATPIRRYEIVLGYLVGFGIFTIFQSWIVSAFSIYVLNLYNAGSIGLMLVVTLVIALCALSLGMFLSAFANNEFQMIQFIPLVIVPQAFFCGLFPIRGMIEPLQWLAKCMPLTYASRALKDVMIKGAVLQDILPDLGILLLFTLFFATFNIVALKKHRTW